jgi:Membrane GTPase LepA
MIAQKISLKKTIHGACHLISGSLEIRRYASPRVSYQRLYHKSTRVLRQLNGGAEKRLPCSILTDIDLIESIPLEDVRNFCIVAHVDHGKSSLASRILELTGNLGVEQQWAAIEHAGWTDRYKKPTLHSNHKSVLAAADKEQIELLDTLAVERERGITVKASAATMLYPHPSAKGPNGVLLLNLIDTPGHIDFGTEVTRTLSSVQGAVLLFDAAQGPQAQSISVHEKAKKMDNVKTIIPVLTKVDLPAARTLDVSLSVSELFDHDPDTILHTSARSRIGISDVLDAVCKDIPPPVKLPDDDDKILRAKVVDSWFEPQRGVVCLVQVLSGELHEACRVSIIEPYKNAASSRTPDLSEHWSNAKEHYSIQDVGLVLPKRLRTKRIRRGQLGYVIVGLRDPRQAKPGAIMTLQKDLGTVLNMHLPRPSIFEENASKSVLYASVHPMEGEGFDDLAAAVDRLALNDTGLEIHRTAGNSNSDGGPFLGPGLRVGFQGLLHVEVFQQRLADEQGLKAIVTPPKVPYRVTYLPSKSNKRSYDAPETEIIEDLSKWPGQGVRFKVEEPMVDVRIMAPIDYAGSIMDLIKRKRGVDMESKPIDEYTFLFTAVMPWGEVVTSFFDDLKNCSAGYASFDYKESDPPFRESNLCKVDIVLNGDVVDPLAFVCHKDSAYEQGKAVCKKLQDVLPRQQFVTVIQAKADSKIVASERIRAYRKDVLKTGGSKTVGGGDITRKKKLLEKQKKGKKRAQSTGRVTLSQAAFNSVISR